MPNCPHCKKELTPEQVASLLGSMTSKAKKISSAENGKLGGRPKKSKKIPTKKRVELTKRRNL